MSDNIVVIKGDVIFEGYIGDFSDGSHSFNDLYRHRNILFITLCKQLKEKGKYVWRSKLHSDGTFYENWFLLGIGDEKGEQATYHLPFHMWKMTEFADTREKGVEWDGHTADDVLDRLTRFYLEEDGK